MLLASLNIYSSKNQKITNIKYSLILLFVLCISKISGQLYINEFQAYNASAYLEKYWGNFPDWIEIYNSGDHAINLSGYYITDDINDPEKWELPSDMTIYSGGFVILYADKISYKEHTNFSLSGKGEQIALFSPELVLIDSVSFGKQYPDISYGRYPNGSENWCYYEDITPKKNNSPDYLQIAKFASEPLFSINGGIYTGTQSISISTSSPAAIIKYTLNGSYPTTNSDTYTIPIQLSSTTVIRATAFEDSAFSSKTVTQTYFINREFSLPVISISTDSRYFYDNEVGIYVVGTNGITGNCAETPRNYNQDWERPINIELYYQNGNPGFNQITGTKIFGACSRRSSLKSLSIFARKKYGDKDIDCKIFRDKDIDEFKSIILRNSGNDFRNTMLRDGIMHNLVKDRMDIDYQEYQPAIVYFNGDYRGILNIREKINENYLEANHEVNPDSVDILNKHVHVVEGDDIHYQNMMSFVSSNDMTNPDNYEYLETQMDINQFINYQLAEIYFFNQDWPEGNIKYWRPQTEDGRWRWLLYDTDFGLGLHCYNDNMVEWATRTHFSTELFCKLLTNDVFSSEFLQRLSSHMNTSFQPERVIQIIDSLSGFIEAEMPQHIEKCNFPGSMSNWYDEIQIMKDFASDRLAILTNNLINKFNLDGIYELTTSVSEPEKGKIRITGVEIPNNYSGLYFKNLPVRIEAIPNEGYKFSGWEGASSSTLNEIQINLSSDSFIVANFSVVDTIRTIHINEFSSKSDNAIQDEHEEYEDWIELYNSGTEAVDLAGLCLTDSIQHLNKFIISSDQADSTILYPDSTIVFYADNDTKQGLLHLNFKLSNNGEKLALSQKIGDDLIIIDSASYKQQYKGITIGRIPDGIGISQFVIPTPGDHNLNIDIVSNLYINEIASSNTSLIADNYGEYNDWIEIYNDNDVAVNIGGLFISDNPNNNIKHRIPTTYSDSTSIPPKGHILLWADDQKTQGILHLNFKLSSNGEQIRLVQPDGIHLLDSITYTKQYLDVTYGRYPDGENSWDFMNATPSDCNILIDYSGLYINEFLASNSSVNCDKFNEYDDWVEIYNSNDFPVDIGGLYLTDTLPEPHKYRIPTLYSDSTTISPKGFLLFWADNQSEQGILHLNFKLSSKGEQIGLSQFKYSEFKYIDSLTFGNQYTNFSTGRIYDGAGAWTKFIIASPGANNIISNTATQQSDDENLIIYPNPVSDGIIYLSQNRNIRLYNSFGQLMYVKNDIRELHVKSLPQGLYILQTERGEIIQIVIF